MKAGTNKQWCLSDPTIKNENDHLTSQVTGRVNSILSASCKRQLYFYNGWFKIIFWICKRWVWQYSKNNYKKSGSIEFSKISSATDSSSFTRHLFGSRSGFTLADTLRGMLTPMADLLLMCYFMTWMLPLNRKQNPSRGIILSDLKQFSLSIKFRLTYRQYENWKNPFHNQPLSYTENLMPYSFNFLPK